MITVAAGEHSMLSIAQALFGHRGAAVGHGLRRAVPQPRELGAEALDLLEEILATGWVMTLARRGGWRPWPPVAADDWAGEPERLWHRHPPPQVAFSSFAIELCRWLAGSALADRRCPASFEHRPETDGDQLIAYLAVDLARANRLARSVAAQPGIQASFLCWLGFPQLLASAAPEAQPPPALAIGEGAVPLFLEALSLELADRLVAVEWDKSRLVDVAEMVAIGEAQESVLAGFLAELARVDRRDLARCVVVAAARLASAPPDLIGHLDTGVAIAERARGRRAAASFIRALGLVHRWSEEARGVRFFEEEYDRGQQLLEMWELLGESRYRELVAIAARLEAIEGADP